MCLAEGSTKQIVCSLPKKMFPIASYLSDHLHQASHLKFVEFVPPFSRVVLLKFNQSLTKSVSQRTQIMENDAEKPFGAHSRGEVSKRGMSMLTHSMFFSSHLCLTLTALTYTP